MTQSTYFLKHYDVSSYKQQFKVGDGHESVKDLADSMEQSMREDHFGVEENGTKIGKRNVIESSRDPD